MAIPFILHSLPCSSIFPSEGEKNSRKVSISLLRLLLITSHETWLARVIILSHYVNNADSVHVTSIIVCRHYRVYKNFVILSASTFDFSLNTSGTSVTELVSQARANLRAGPYQLEMISACTTGAYHL